MAKEGEDDFDLYGDLYGEDGTETADTPAEKTAPVESAASSDPRLKNSAGAATMAVSTAATPAAAAYTSAQYGTDQAPAGYNAYAGGNADSYQTYGSMTQPLQASASQPAGTYTSLNSATPALRVRPQDMPEEGKMFIGGLNWDTTDDGLKTYFEQFGTVTHCTIMRDAETGRSRGFAFLTFAEPASVNNVMVREHYLDGKIIDPKRAIPRADGAKTDKLFVRSIPSSCTQESFRAYWRAFGNITDATLMMDKESGRHRGFGFVNYDTVDSVERVLGQQHVMDGQVLEVKRAQVKGDSQGSSRPRNEGFNNSNTSNFNASNGAASSGGTPFDPQAMAKFFQQMNWGGWNPMMMMGGGMAGGMGGGMPGGMGGMGAMPGQFGFGGMPGMNMMGFSGMPGMTGAEQMPAMYAGDEQQAAPAQEAARAPAAASRPGRGRGWNPPTGPAAMRGSDAPGPARSRGGGAAFHPYSRQ